MAAYGENPMAAVRVRRENAIRAGSGLAEVPIELTKLRAPRAYAGDPQSYTISGGAPHPKRMSPKGATNRPRPVGKIVALPTAESMFQAPLFVKSTSSDQKFRIAIDLGPNVSYPEQARRLSTICRITAALLSPRPRTS